MKSMCTLADELNVLRIPKTDELKDDLCKVLWRDDLNRHPYDSKSANVGKVSDKSSDAKQKLAIELGLDKVKMSPLEAKKFADDMAVSRSDSLTAVTSKYGFKDKWAALIKKKSEKIVFDHDCKDGSKDSFVIDPSTIADTSPEARAFVDACLESVQLPMQLADLKEGVKMLRKEGHTDVTLENVLAHVEEKSVALDAALKAASGLAPLSAGDKAAMQGAPAPPSPFGHGGSASGGGGGGGSYNGRLFPHGGRGPYGGGAAYASGSPCGSGHGTGSGGSRSYGSPIGPGYINLFDNVYVGPRGGHFYLQPGGGRDYFKPP